MIAGKKNIGICPFGVVLHVYIYIYMYVELTRTIKNLSWSSVKSRHLTPNTMLIDSDVVTLLDLFYTVEFIAISLLDSHLVVN